jgi:3-hydroxyacyl-CoA dehydrogenase
MTTPDVGNTARRQSSDAVAPQQPVANPPDWLSVGREADIAALRISVWPEPKGGATGLVVLANVLQAIQRDPTVRAIVLGGPAAFLDEGDLDDRHTDCKALRQAIADSAVPVVAAISRSALGSGLALALSCRFRVASASARFGFPDIRAGLLATGDVVRRLIAIVPLQDAIELLAFGTTLTADAARRCGLADSIADGPVLDAAVAFAMTETLRTGAAVPARPHPVRQFAEFRAKAERRAPGQLGPALAIDALEQAARHSAERSDAEITRLAELLRQSDQGRAMRYAADCVAAKLRAAPPARATDGPTIRSVCLFEPGEAGPDLAVALAAAGIDVILATAMTESAEHALAPRRRARIRVTRDAESADLVIAGPTVSDAAANAAVVRWSAEPLMAMASGPGRPPFSIAGLPLVLHAYAPGGRVRLVEVTGGEDATAPIAAMLRRTGLPVLYRSAGAQGVLIDRLRWPMLREMIHLLDEGATPIQIDRALMGFGFAIAPLAALDREGIGAMMARCIDACGSAAAWPRYSPTLDLMIDAGRHLAAPSHGFYRYEPGSRTPLPDPAFERLLHDSAMAQRLQRRTLPDAEVVQRCVLAAVNEAAASLEDGAAPDAASIDALWTHVLGFPRWRGGPLYDADGCGLPAVLAAPNHIAAMHRTIPPTVALLTGAAEAGSRLTVRYDTMASVGSVRRQ